MDYGEWEGLTYEQIAERDGERRRAWEEDPETTACPGGESGSATSWRHIRSDAGGLIGPTTSSGTARAL